jgi:hypothetical protein
MKTWKDLSQSKKIFYSISAVLGIIAISGLAMGLVGRIYDLKILALVGFIMTIPFAILLSIVILSYARI